MNPCHHAAVCGHPVAKSKWQGYNPLTVRSFRKDVLDEMFGRDALGIVAKPVNFNFRYRDAKHWLEIFRGYYGPVLKAFEALDAPKQAALEADLMALLARFNTAGSASLVIPSEYLEIVVTRK